MLATAGAVALLCLTILALPGKVWYDRRCERQRVERVRVVDKLVRDDFALVRRIAEQHDLLPGQRAILDRAAGNFDSHTTPTKNLERFDEFEPTADPQVRGAYEAVLTAAWAT